MNIPFVPDLRERFKSDLAKNFQRMTHNYTKNIFINDVQQEVVMYSCEMCVEFKNEFGALPNEITEALTGQVCDATMMLFDEYGDVHRQRAIRAVKISMTDPLIKNVLRNYYESY